MSRGATERKLAAILAADVVGFSRQMGMEASGTPTSFDNQMNFSLAAGAQSNIVVVYVPASVGHHQDTLSLLSYATAAERRTNFVSLSGDGVAPTAGTPSNANPSNGATDQSVDANLGWQNGTGLPRSPGMAAPRLLPNPRRWHPPSRPR